MARPVSIFGRHVGCQRRWFFKSEHRRAPDNPAGLFHPKLYRADVPQGLQAAACFQREGDAVDTGNEDSGSLLLRYESGMHAVYSQNFFARKGAARRGPPLEGNSFKGILFRGLFCGEAHLGTPDAVLQGGHGGIRSPLHQLPDRRETCRRMRYEVQADIQGGYARRAPLRRV